MRVNPGTPGPIDPTDADRAASPDPVPLAVDDGGSGGTAVVFLHSMAGNTAHWAAQLAHLREERRALAFDLRGHGRSGPPPDADFTMAAYAADVAAAVDALALDHFVLVGHSMGASVAAGFAAAHPQRVVGLMLVDGAHARQEPTPGERARLRRLGTDDYAALIEEFWESILDGSRPPVRDRVIADLRATPKETVVASFGALIDYDPVAALRRYPGPKSLVLSPIGDDPTAPHHHVDDLPHTTLRNVGHWLHMDRPDAFRRTLDAFLDRADVGRSRIVAPPAPDRRRKRHRR